MWKLTLCIATCEVYVLSDLTESVGIEVKTIFASIAEPRTFAVCTVWWTLDAVSMFQVEA